MTLQLKLHVKFNKKNKMKKIIIIAILLLSIKAQSQPGLIVPSNTFLQDIQSGTYIKDMNNEYLPYVGIWKGILNSKEYTFVFQVFAQHLFTKPNGFYHYEDILKAKYEVKDVTTGIILFTTMSSINFEDFHISSLGTPYNGRLNCYFGDTPNNCYNSMTFALENIPGVSNQLHYGGFGYSDFYIKEGCQYTNRMNIPVPIPKKGLIFIKQ